MLYTKLGSIPQPETDGTEGWIPAPDKPECPEGKQVVWLNWEWVIRDPKPQDREGYQWNWNHGEMAWVENEYVVPVQPAPIPEPEVTAEPAPEPEILAEPTFEPVSEEVVETPQVPVELLSTDQIGFLGTDQVSVLTTDQLARLSETTTDQLAALSAMTTDQISRL